MWIMIFLKRSSVFVASDMPRAEFNDEDDFDDDSKKFGAQKPNKPGAANLPKTKTPVLDNFGRDITRLAESGTLDPIVGRENEIERVSQILSRRKKK